AGLAAAGHEVEILGRGPGGARGPKLLFPLTVVPAAFRALRRFRPEVVQVHESDGALVALLTVALRPALTPPPAVAALLQVSYVEERRAVRPLVGPQGEVLGRPGAVERRFRRFKAPFQAALGWLSARLADVVLAPSAATAVEIRRDYEVERVGVLPNVTGGIPVPEISAEQGGAETEGAHAFLFVGRLRIRKGVEVALHALDLLRRRSPDARVAGDLRLQVAGDGEHRTALAALAAELGLGEAVAFLGRADAARVRALLARARALVVPSIYEGMPLVILEAMAAGVPVVASAVSGIPEVVVDGETGWLVPAEDPAALAAALAAVLADPAEAARRGAAGRGRVAERFSPRAAAEIWEREMREIRA
ncbi:MAG TPA: glycosyltransferase, partial [Thermoanaerobaculia bacterium]|nr:glycosyltransferase [Thermoanaerobaculia bacterium]